MMRPQPFARHDAAARRTSPTRCPSRPVRQDMSNCSSGIVLERRRAVRSRARCSPGCRPCRSAARSPRPSRRRRRASPTSTTDDMPSPPSARISSAVRSARWTFSSATQTLAPSRAKTSAMARADALAGARDDGDLAVETAHRHPPSRPAQSSQRLSAQVRHSLVRMVCCTARRTRRWIGAVMHTRCISSSALSPCSASA